MNYHFCLAYGAVTLKYIVNETEMVVSMLIFDSCAIVVYSVFQRFLNFLSFESLSLISFGHPNPAYSLNIILLNNITILHGILFRRILEFIHCLRFCPDYHYAEEFFHYRFFCLTRRLYFHYECKIDMVIVADSIS